MLKVEEIENNSLEEDILKNNGLELPKLKGTDKQIEWGTILRAEMIERITGIIRRIKNCDQTSINKIIFYIRGNLEGISREKAEEMICNFTPKILGFIITNKTKAFWYI